MTRTDLVEYQLTPEELEQAVLEYCARHAPDDIGGKVRYVVFTFAPLDKGKQRNRPSAKALIELPPEDDQ